MVVVGNFIGKIYELSLYDRDYSRKEQVNLSCRGIIRRRVLDKAFSNLERKIQPVETGISLLKLIHDPQGLAVMFESAVILHQSVKNFFSGMAEWCMPKIMSKSQSLSQLLIQPQTPCHRFTDLSNFQGVGKSGSVVIPFMVDENLRFVLKSSECCRVYDPVPVPFKSRPVVTKIFLVTPPERFRTFCRKP